MATETQTKTMKRRRVRRSRDANDITKIKTDPYIKRNIPYYEMLTKKASVKLKNMLKLFSKNLVFNFEEIQ